MLKVLQIFTVIIFAVMVLFGGVLVIFAPDRISAFLQYGGFILPAWLTSITASFLGRPITEAAAGLKAKWSATTTTTTDISTGDTTKTQTPEPTAPVEGGS